MTEKMKQANHPEPEKFPDHKYLKIMKPKEILNQITEKYFKDNCVQSIFNEIRYNIEFLFQIETFPQECPGELLLLLFFIGKLQTNIKTKESNQALIDVVKYNTSFPFHKIESLASGIDDISLIIVEEQINKNASKENILLIKNTVLYLEYLIKPNQSTTDVCWYF